MSKLAHYWKALVAFLSPVVIVVQSAVTDDVITQEEWVKIGVAVVAAVGVLVVANKPKTPPVSNDQTPRPYRSGL
jgi:hypothetical protein